MGWGIGTEKGTRAYVCARCCAPFPTRSLFTGSGKTQTRTQSPLTYSFSRWNMGRRSMRAKPFGKKGEKATTHKPQCGQEKRLGASLGKTGN